MSLGNLTASIRAQEARTSQFPQDEWDNARPNSYETWQRLAKVLATGGTNFYKPTQLPDTHRKNQLK